MTTVLNLHEKTRGFFRLHWPSDANPPPTWVKWEPFLSAPGPNYDRVGCYALVKDNEILYVGQGMRKGRPGSRYENHGISARLNDHVLLVNWQQGAGYILHDRWLSIGVDAAYTIGLTEYVLLAVALEYYLSGELRPIANSQYKPR